MRVLYSTLMAPPSKCFGGERHHVILAKRISKDKKAEVRIFTYNVDEYREIWSKLHSREIKKDSWEGIGIVRFPPQNAKALFYFPSWLSHKLLWKLSKNEKIGDSLLHLLRDLASPYIRRIGYTPPEKVMEEFKRYSPEIVHVYGVHWAYLPNLLAKLAKEEKSRLIIWTIYHFMLRIEREYFSRKEVREVLREADVLISSTNAERREIIKLCGEKVSEKCHVLPVPIEVEEFKIPKKELIEDFRQKIGNPDKIILSMTLNKEKGVFQVIEALKRMRDEGEIAMVTFGRAKPKEIREFEEIRRKMPKNVHLYYLGYVPEEIKEAAFVCSDLFAMPSLSDSFGIAYAEAWYYGSPVIACKNEVMEEVIGNLKRGILVPYGDVGALERAIRTLLEDRELARKLVERGRRYLFETLNSKVVSERVYALYEEALGRG